MITKEEIEKRDSPDYYYVIKYVGPSIINDIEIIEYVGSGGSTNKLSDALKIGNLDAAKRIYHNMRIYYGSRSDHVHIYKVVSTEVLIQ